MHPPPRYKLQQSRDDLDVGTYSQKENRKNMVIGSKSVKKGHFEAIHSKKYEAKESVASPRRTKDDANFKYRKQKKKIKKEIRTSTRPKQKKDAIKAIPSRNVQVAELKEEEEEAEYDTYDQYDYQH